MRQAILAIGIMSLLSSEPASALDKWAEINPAIKKKLESLPGTNNKQSNAELSPVFIDTGSLRTIKSVNHPGRRFIRADFSFYEDNRARTRRIVVDCDDWFYKDNDTELQWDWVPPLELIISQGKILEYAALTYLCKDSANPWKILARSESGDSYYYNGGYKIQKSPYYGELRKNYVASDGEDSQLVLYASCSNRKMRLYSWSEDPGPRYAELSPALPLTVGEAMIESICGLTPRQMPDSRDNRVESSNPAPSTGFPSKLSTSLMERYEEAVRAQRELMESLMGR